MDVAQGPAAYAQAAAVLAANPARRAALAKSGRAAYFDAYDWPRLAGRLTAAAQDPSR